MKNVIILLAIVLCSIASHAQRKKIKGNGNITTVIRNVSDYNKIGVSGSFDIKLEKGKEGTLTIKAEDNILDYLITEVEGENLKIKWKKGITIKTTKRIRIIIPFEEIEEVALAGSGDVSSTDVVKTDTFKIALAGAGDVELKLNVSTLKVAISGSGDVDLTGTATNLDCALSGSGDVDADKLITEKASIRIAGSGDVSVHVNEELDVRVSGSGDVSYTGNPKKNTSKVSGSGSVRSMQ